MVNDQNQPHAPNRMQDAGRLMIARYRNNSEGVRITAWLNLFELVTTDAASDVQRITCLMRYVEGEALTWFGDEIAPRANQLTWAQVKQQMMTRFGEIIIRPLIAAHKRTLRQTETVQKYFEEKMDLMRQTTMTEDDRIASLTEGMPFSYQTHLISCSTPTTAEWLNKALMLEASIGRRRFLYKPQAEAAVASGMPHAANGPKQNEQKRPLTPCKFCKAQGREVFHWHNECSLNPHPKKTRNHHGGNPHAASPDAEAAAAEALVASGN